MSETFSCPCCYEDYVLLRSPSFIQPTQNKTMNHTIPPKVFHSSRSKSAFSAVCSSLFVMIGIPCFSVQEAHLFAYVFTVLGSIGLASSIIFYLQKVIITPSGITKKPRGFSIDWENVDSWMVEDIQSPSEDSFTKFSIRIKICDRRIMAKIDDSEVTNPGFEKLLQEIRRYVPQKERRRTN